MLFIEPYDGAYGEYFDTNVKKYESKLIQKCLKNEAAHNKDQKLCFSPKNRVFWAKIDFYQKVTKSRVFP